MAAFWSPGFLFSIRTPSITAMTRALPRSHFNCSNLSRVLDGYGFATSGETGPTSAERLGAWLSAADAMRLYAALNGGAEPDRSSASPLAGALSDQCNRLRTTLTQAIEHSCRLNPPARDGSRLRFPLPDPALPDAVAADYEPYRRFQLAHQREMDVAITPLRARARQVLAQSGPALARLAAVDAALGDILAGREARLLATLPALLERRFVELREAGQADDRTAWLAQDGWLARFCRELQTALLAELDLRLQPLAGLIDALDQEVSPP